MNPDILSIFFKMFRQANPLQVPQWGPYRERYPLAGHFYIRLNMSLIVFLSESPVREPPPCSLIGSPWTRILRHQSHWPSEGIIFIHSFIHVRLPESPERSPATYGGKHKVTVHGAPSRRRAYIKWGAACFSKGIVNNTAISPPPCAMQPSARYCPPWLG
jgi:hypothetical protein